MSLRNLQAAACTLFYLHINNISHKALQDELMGTPFSSVAVETGLPL